MDERMEREPNQEVGTDNEQIDLGARTAREEPRGRPESAADQFRPAADAEPGQDLTDEELENVYGGVSTNWQFDW